MKFFTYSVLFSGMLLAFLALACQQVAGQDLSASNPQEGRKQIASNAPGSRSSWDALRRKAEAEAARAAVLRQKLTAKELNSSIRLLEDSARLFTSSGVPLKASGALLEVGDTDLMTSRYSAALKSYRRALRLANAEAGMRCLALSHMARTYATMGKSLEADRYSAQALSLCEAQSNPRARADALEVQGEAFFWSGEAPKAVAPLRRARDLFAEAEDDDGQALASLMLAYALGTSDRAESLRLTGDALRLWASRGNLYGVAKARMAFGFYASTSGQFELAQCNCSEAFSVFHKIADKDNEAIALNILGMVAGQSGDVEASLKSYRRARSDFAAVQDALGEAESISGMGLALTSQRNYGALLPLYTRKLHLAQRSGNGALVASCWLDIADAYLRQHRYPQADVNYQKALAKYRAAGNRYGESTALMRLADLRTEQGRSEEALKLFDQAQELKEQTGQIEDLARIQYARARVYRRLNRPEEARTEIEKTIAIIESQRLRITKFDSRAQYFASVHEYYSLYIQVLMALHQLQPDQGYMQLAFEAAERSKVRALLDLLDNSKQATSCDELLARDSGPNLDPRVEDVKAGIPDPASAQALTLTEIQSEIGDGDTLLLEYALGDEKSYAWLVDGEKILAHELPSAAEIRRSARAFRQALMPPTAREHETASEYLQRQHASERAQLLHSRELGRLLLSGLDLPAGKRVLVVPDGPLQYVPFAALPVTGRRTGTTPLIAHHDVTMLPSASVLAALRKAAAKRSPPTAGVAIIADPVFENAETSSPAHAAMSAASGRSHDLKRALQDIRGSQHIVRLPGSRSEALAIQEIVGPEHARLALGFDANRKSVINGSLAHYRVIHFATHGIADTRHPEMSGLILSLLSPRGDHQDGYLRLSDIYNLKLSADLVVLSSCDSALGKDLESEGIIGLPRGFLYAGARAVIASLWKVDDDATAELMKGLYGRMQQGKSPQAALRESQLELARDSRYRQPYYWAAFVLEGDYK